MDLDTCTSSAILGRVNYNGPQDITRARCQNIDLTAEPFIVQKNSATSSDWIIPSLDRESIRQRTYRSFAEHTRQFAREILNNSRHRVCLGEDIEAARGTHYR